MLYMILYAICIIIRKKVIKLQYSKLNFGDGSCLISATCWGWVTNILCHYEGVGHDFLKNWVFISSGPPPPVYFDQPLNLVCSVRTASCGALFFLPCFHPQKEGKTKIHNLPYGPSTWLVRVVCGTYLKTERVITEKVKVYERGVWYLK